LLSRPPAGAEWWTFAGTRANATLAGELLRLCGGRIDHDARGGELGDALLLSDRGVGAEPAEARRREGQTVMSLAVEGRLAVVLGVADQINAAAPEALRERRDEGIRVVMLTGDSRATAEAVARKRGIDEVEAQMRPAGKARVVERLRREGRVVAMAGDGINDAPALAQAQIGIAMGTGTDVAIESAGVTLVHGDLRGMARARRLSRATMRNIRQNLFLAFVYNTLAVPLAAFGLLIGLAVAPSNPKRVYALIESKTPGILWRSDDAGANWTLVSKNTLVDQRFFYFSHVRVDPTDADHVYGISEELSESKDGG